jgi:hypothetical protein
METVNGSIEITKHEWMKRKLTTFGYMYSLVDVLSFTLNFILFLTIATNIESFAQYGPIYFWGVLSFYFFLQAGKIIVKLTSPLNSYQTLVIKEP